MGTKKYNTSFDRDFNWYISMRHNFNFDGSADYYNKKGEQIIVHNKDGVSGKEAFFQWDSNGKIKPTKHPALLGVLLKTKGSCNLHIKMYAEDRVSGLLNKIEFKEICQQFKAPTWFATAVEMQKQKLGKAK